MRVVLCPQAMDEEEALREAAAVGDLRTELAAAEGREAAGARPFEVCSGD